MRDLVFRQASTSASISNNVVYLNDFRATLNDTDFVIATGTLNLRRPYRYSGKVSANVANLSTFSRCFALPATRAVLAGRSQTRLGRKRKSSAASQTFN